MPRESRYANDDRFMRRIAREFYEEKKTPKEITSGLQRDYREFKPGTFYYLLSLLKDKGIISYNIPVEEAETKKLRKAFTFKKDEILVVRDPADVPEFAAQEAAKILLERWKNTRQDNPKHEQEPITLGLGPGGMTARLTLELGKILANEASAMKLRLLAMSGGSVANRPELSPISFFNTLPSRFVSEKIGLFAPNLVTQKQYEALSKNPGVREAMEASKDLYLCITAMGDSKDKTDLLSQFLHAQPDETAFERLQSKGMRGNIQYRPFSDEGPIKESPSDYRAVTVLDLNDMHRLSRDRDKEIILMVSNKSGEALWPLVRSSKFRPFTRLVIDAESVERLLRYAEDK